MKTGIILLLATMILGTTACGPAVRLYSDQEPSASFDQYHSYSFMDFTEGNKETIPGMELERIRTAMARELEHRGLTYVPEGSDVSVKIVVYHRQGPEPFPYRWGYRPMERAISVDMFDNHTRKHIWHCAAVGELVYNSDRRAEQLPAVAEKIFEKYPVPPLTAQVSAK